MDERKLREKIAQLLQNNSSNIIDNIITGAGMPTKSWMEVAKQTIALIKEAGYVKLAEDQNLPENYFPPGTIGFAMREKAEQDMLKAGWRKVENEKD